MGEAVVLQAMSTLMLKGPGETRPAYRQFILGYSSGVSLAVYRSFGRDEMCGLFAGLCGLKHEGSFQGSLKDAFKSHLLYMRIL